MDLQYVTKIAWLSFDKIWMGCMSIAEILSAISIVLEKERD